MAASYPVPEHVHAAQSQVAQVLQQVEGKPVDLVKAPWAELEKSVVKLLGGPFQPNSPEHQTVALGLAGALAQRLHEEHKAFWFPNRDSPEGATLGFPDALIMLSPFGAVVDALMQSKLARLDDLGNDIRRSLAQVRFGATAGQQPQRMQPEDYQRLFDPGFLQFVVLDPQKAKAAFENRPEVLARDIREALGRTNPPLPQEVKASLDGQLVRSLERLETGKSLADQVERAPRLVELMGHLFATVGGTGSAPEEFWQGLVLPLLFIGAPDGFPPLDADELEAFKQGADPLALFVDVVPYAQPAPEDGLLGAFEAADVQLPHPSFARAGALRLLQLKGDRIKGLLEKFDAAKSRDAIARFGRYLEEKSGQKAPAQQGQTAEMLEAAMQLLTDFKRALTSTQGQLHLRRLTEGEAASEQALALVRGALQGPRIILA